MLDVRRERLQNRLGRDRRMPRVAGDSDVVVGDQREVGVAEAQLAREPALGIGGHVDEIPADRPVPGALGPGREARALDHDDRPSRVHRQAELRARGEEGRAQVGAVGIGRRHVADGGAVEERVLAARRAIDELVADDERARRRSARSEPAAHGATMRVTPSERSAQRFAR